LNYININGSIINTKGSQPAFHSRSFRYGYGIFETLLIKDGAIMLKDYHWERLFASAKQLYFNIPKLFTAERLEEEILHLAAKNQCEHLCRIRLQLFADGGGLFDGHSQTPEYIIECFLLEEPVIQLNENGLVIGIAEGLNKSVDALSHLKSCSALIYVIAAQQAKAYQWNDALILNTKGNIIESTIANIFWIKDSIVHTPPLSEGCVAGVMRRKLLNDLPALGMKIIEQPLTGEILMNADEVFLTNAIRRIKWVASVNEKKIKNDTIARIFRSLFN
jgi:branched-chain amino acid aminotransferase